MDGLELLRQDHDRVRTLFTSFREAADAEDGTQMAELVGEIFHELEVHTAIEEEVFYPMIHDAGGQDLTDHTDESYEEHHVVDVLMEEIRGLSADDPSFKAKMTVLMENVEHHASEEEDEMFPQVRELFSQDQLEQLGEELQAAKTRHETAATTKEDLLEQAREMDIEGRSSMTKDQLAEEIGKRSER